MAIDLKKLKDVIGADAVLKEHGAKGRDQAIADELNRVRDDVDVPRGTVQSQEFLTLLDPSEFATLTQVQSQSFGLFLASGAVDLSAQPTDDLAAIMPEKTRAKIVAHKTRKGSVAERDLGGPVTVSDVGKAMKADRPGGKANNGN